MVNVSIVTYHTPLDELRTVLAALDSPAVDTIYIVDNGRDAATECFCRDAGVRYIPSDNRGYGAAHNIAMRLTLADGIPYHLVINSDLRFTSADLQAMLRRIEAEPAVGLLHPRIVGEDGADQFTVRRLPTPFDLILRRFLPRWLFAGRRRRYLMADVDHGSELSVAYVQGSFMLLRADVLREVGLFDERFFMYPEDIDLSRRIAARHRVLYFPGATVVHAHRAASYHSLRMAWIHATNMIRYFNKWGWLHDPDRRRLNARCASLRER